MGTLIDIEQARASRRAAGHRAPASGTRQPPSSPARQPPASRHTFFSRSELCKLLGLYSRRVVNGEWRDYAIDHDATEATVSFYRCTAGHPEFAITKTAGHKDRPGLFVLRAGPQEITQSPSLEEVIGAVERQPRLVWSSVG
ncbi:MAG: DUF2794 domain-containing protein [Rhodospirillaceae bacterium]|nr:DUF2794 domain-containing protein [Rhodospirillaceae bacterium]